jgi:hypothetical protein
VRALLAVCMAGGLTSRPEAIGRGRVRSSHRSSGAVPGVKTRAGWSRRRATRLPSSGYGVSVLPQAAQGKQSRGKRDLAAEYQVAVGTARRAVEELRRRGLALTLPAKGIFVNSPGK